MLSAELALYCTAAGAIHGTRDGPGVGRAPKYSGRIGAAL